MDLTPDTPTPVALRHLDAPHGVSEGLASAWLTAGGDMPDAEVWLALALEEHPRHAAARAYWAQLHAGHSAGTRPPLWFSRVTMLALVRQLCRYSVPRKGTLDLRAAWTVYRAFRGLPGVGLLAEPDDCDLQVQALMSAQALPAHLWTAVYLGALSQATGVRLVSFNPELKRLALDRWLLLGA